MAKEAELTVTNGMGHKNGFVYDIHLKDADGYENTYSVTHIYGKWYITEEVDIESRFGKKLIEHVNVHRQMMLN